MFCLGVYLEVFGAGSLGGAAGYMVRMCIYIYINQSSALGRLGGLYSFLSMLQLTLHLAPGSIAS